MAQIKELKQTTLKSKDIAKQTVYPLTTSDAVIVPKRGKLTPLLKDYDNKQDKLIPGKDIEITSNNVINNVHTFFENDDIDSIWNIALNSIENS